MRYIRLLRWESLGVSFPEVVPLSLLLVWIGLVTVQRKDGVWYTCHALVQRILASMRLEGLGHARNAKSQPFRIHLEDCAVRRGG